MDWSPNTTHQMRLARAKLLQQIRAYFLNHEVLEVETPALSQGANTDPFIESFKTNSARYLHTSPEYPMKRLLAAGCGDIYQICKVWRAAESGSKHNPEFTLLEWYRIGFTYQQLMQEVSDLLNTVIVHLEQSPQYFSYAQLFLEKFSINPHVSCRDQLLKCVNTEIPSLDTNDLGQQAMLDALLTHCIEPDFDEDRLTFIYDYPASQSALAQLREHENYSVAERFEVYLGHLELGNGYQEEVNAKRNREILERENQTRAELGFGLMPEDELFLSACDSGIPASAGVAIGLDRVLMAITGEKSIQNVINFPWDKA
ncbi:MAG: EF-P lysine aminoacylase EpmA [Cocleimonas sp.]